MLSKQRSRDQQLGKGLHIGDKEDGSAIMYYVGRKDFQLYTYVQ